MYCTKCNKIDIWLLCAPQNPVGQIDIIMANVESFNFHKMTGSPKEEFILNTEMFKVALLKV